MIAGTSAATPTTDPTERGTHRMNIHEPMLITDLQAADIESAIEYLRDWALEQQRHRPGLEIANQEVSR